MIIERDPNNRKLEQQVNLQLSEIMKQIDPTPVKSVDRTGTNFVSVEDALRELQALGVEV